MRTLHLPTPRCPFSPGPSGVASLPRPPGRDWGGGGVQSALNSEEGPGVTGSSSGTRALIAHLSRAAGRTALPLGGHDGPSTCNPPPPPPLPTTGGDFSAVPADPGPALLWACACCPWAPEARLGSRVLQLSRGPWNTFSGAGWSRLERQHQPSSPSTCLPPAGKHSPGDSRPWGHDLVFL